ncbi:hypothetical protein HHK36_006671 [Tetracentron sinense]|uniref:NADP-dependent oxidoreductase domain-containing protein n=1 Tax=Tetracentron sinense TaxID=13715 RepID=A0A835DPF2_TETSI|nr:hypothetical protein HHK36_006671 [Tetracentron sinense]
MGENVLRHCRFVQNRGTLGHAVAEALRRGLIGIRDDLFITSKLWCTDAHPDLEAWAGLEYVDLYLVHVPARLKKGEMVYPFNKEDILPFDMRGTWEAMEECSRLGLAKSIGVSNFDCEKLSQLLAHATIPPAINQVLNGQAFHGNDFDDGVITDKISGDDEIVSGEIERCMSAEEADRFLQGERDSCECMVSFGGKWNLVGFYCCDGQSNPQRNCPG